MHFAEKSLQMLCVDVIIAVHYSKQQKTLNLGLFMSSYIPFDQVKNIAVLGTGVIGSSWASYFLAHGYSVSAWDPGKGWEGRLHAFIDTAWPQLKSMGLAPNASKGALTLYKSPEEAVKNVDFVQESAPERKEIKQELFAKMDHAIPEYAIFSSSTSGLILSDLVSNIDTAHRFIVGHPFNPPHLIPLVEVVAGQKTDTAVTEWAMGFYKHIGKHSILIKKEVRGHLANRLQAALWREATLALVNGLASIEDINAAISKGPGLRLAVMGPHMIFNLTGGKGGFQHFYNQFGPAMEAWWKTMQGEPELTQELCDAIIAGLKDEAGSRTIDDLEAERDTKLLNVLKALKS